MNYCRTLTFFDCQKEKKIESGAVNELKHWLFRISGSIRGAAGAHSAARTGWVGSEDPGSHVHLTCHRDDEREWERERARARARERERERARERERERARARARERECVWEKRLLFWASSALSLVEKETYYRTCILERARERERARARARERERERARESVCVWEKRLLFWASSPLSLVEKETYYRTCILSHLL